MNKIEFLNWLETEQKNRKEGFFLPYYRKIYQNSDDYWNIVYPCVDSDNFTSIKLIEDDIVVLMCEDQIDRSFTYDEFIKENIYDF